MHNRNGVDSHWRFLDPQTRRRHCHQHLRRHYSFFVIKWPRTQTLMRNFISQLVTEICMRMRYSQRFMCTFVFQTFTVVKFCCLSVLKRPVYTCDFWCDFWCDFAYKTRLTLPCTNVYFAKHLVDWKGMTYFLKAPFFRISANLAVFCRGVTRL